MFRGWKKVMPELTKEKYEVEASYDGIINKFRYVSRKLKKRNYDNIYVSHNQ